MGLNWEAKRRRLWGTVGTGDGQFQFPFGMAFNATEVYVADRFNHRIQVFAVLNPAEAIEDLIEKAMNLNLQQGIENSLDAKLDAALQTLDDLKENNNVAAINTL